MQVKGRHLDALGFRHTFRDPRCRRRQHDDAGQHVRAVKAGQQEEVRAELDVAPGVLGEGCAFTNEMRPLVSLHAEERKTADRRQQHVLQRAAAIAGSVRGAAGPRTQAAIARSSSSMPALSRNRSTPVTEAALTRCPCSPAPEPPQKGLCGFRFRASEKPLQSQ